MAWIRIIPGSEAEGALADVYARMKSRPLPAVYQTTHGDVAAILGAHGRSRGPNDPGGRGRAVWASRSPHVPRVPACWRGGANT
jgi:hypothetical protein